MPPKPAARPCLAVQLGLVPGPDKLGSQREQAQTGSICRAYHVPEGTPRRHLQGRAPDSLLQAQVPGSRACQIWQETEAERGKLLTLTGEANLSTQLQETPSCSSSALVKNMGVSLSAPPNSAVIIHHLSPKTGSWRTRG